MRRLLHFLVIAVPTSLCLASPACGQSPQQFDCRKEKDPFFSYCGDINNFLTVAAAHKDAEGKIDRANPDTKAALRSFLFVDSDPTRLTSLLAPYAAIQGAIASLPASPDNNSPVSLTTLAAANQNRPDQQTGPGSNANGTTSLVEKAGTAAVLAFALESGALTRSVNGNTATLSGNADGLLRALTGQQVLCFDCKGAMGTAVLRNINLSAAFMINQESTSTVSTSGAANSSTPPSIGAVVIPSSVGKLSGLKARYQLWNPYDPHSSKFLAAWQAAVVKAKDQLNNQAQDLQGKLKPLLVSRPIQSDLNFQQTLQSYASRFYDDADTGDLTRLKDDFMSLFDASVDVRTKNDPEFIQNVASVNVSLAQYKDLWNQLLAEAKGQPLLTFEYSFNRLQNQPETHDFRLILGYTPKSAAGLFSVNAAASIYGNTIPAGAKYGRLHDGQVSVEYDRPFTLKSNPNQATFGLAAYWQYQPDPSVLNITSGNLVPGTTIQLPQNAQVLLGTAGSLWVTQAKITINGKSGIKIPIGVSWSNKTDLLAGSKVGAQVGISYDFSSLSSLFGSRL